ncbi:MAG: translesion error-prone DNA polymerase V autoproteolytic subunit [Gammaproteobacteria bacterium]|jgi:DNA polymerase V
MALFRITKPQELAASLSLPLYSSRVSAGFPSPADDFIERSLDLNEFLIKHPASTFFAWAQGESLKGIGIHDGDLLIVDRAAERQQGVVVVAAIDGELTCKILDLRGGKLLAANPDYPPIDLRGREDLLVEGVVIYSIRKHTR